MKRIKPFVLFLREQNDTGYDEYSFEELSDEAKEKALDAMRDINTDRSGWDEPITTDFENEMGEFGLDNVKISYSGFYSQGDGASFTGNVIDAKTFMAKALDMKDTEWIDMSNDENPEDEGSRLRADLLDIGFDTREKLTPDNFYIEIVRTSNRHSHENTIEGKVSIEDIPESIEDEIPSQAIENEIQGKVTNWARAKSKELYRNLERYYDDLTSDEEVKGTIIANEYKFDEDGTLI